MPTIGKFTQSDGIFTGCIITMSIQADGVTILPVASKSSARAPDWRIISPHGAHIGAGWDKTSAAGTDYISVKIDDPSFSAPVYATITQDDDGEAYSMIWSR